ncbi:MAG: hypothetical protein M1415_06660 [Firmicutes bacterium]|nr:hypothetical protein [Bacillota bacterium]MCL5064370.1 hypothetical protein [Bacillota bacterium]
MLVVIYILIITGVPMFFVTMPLLKYLNENNMLPFPLPFVKKGSQPKVKA